MIKEFNKKRHSNKISRQESKKQIIEAVNLQEQELQELIEEMRLEEEEYFEDMRRFDAKWYEDEDEPDPYEEFLCGQCGKEIIGRYIFCSQECEDLFNKGLI